MTLSSYQALSYDLTFAAVVSDTAAAAGRGSPDTAVASLFFTVIT